ncbi:MAG: hypothetical protein NVS9B4_00250 [Candidatus Acidiferrum sp.]
MNTNIDTVSGEVYSAQYHERRTMRFALIAVATVMLVQAVVIERYAMRPAETRWVRINELGQATPIAYSDLNYTPKEGEIRAALAQWAGYRYSRLASSVSKAYPRNYLFLNAPLAEALMNEDYKNHAVANVAAGNAEENDADITNIVFTTLAHERIRNAPVYTGTALIDLAKTFASPARKERWQVAVRFYLNPADVGEHSKVAPEFGLYNPLGLVITEFHESPVRAIE